jgi:hypothetical protein
VAPLFEIRLFDDLGGVAPYYEEMVCAETPQEALLHVARPRSCEKIARRGRTEEWWRVADLRGADRFARVLPLIG